jgi:hypothetical protein
MRNSGMSEATASRGADFGKSSEVSAFDSSIGSSIMSACDGPTSVKSAFGKSSAMVPAGPIDGNTLAADPHPLNCLGGAQP